MKNKNDFSLISPVEALGPPPNGWRVDSTENHGAGVYTVALRNDSAARILLKMSPRSASSPAHCRTANFNILMTEHSENISASALKSALQYFFAMFEANDPAGISRDNLQSNSPRKNSAVARAMKPAMFTGASKIKTLDSFSAPGSEPDFKKDYELLLSKPLKNIEKILFISDPYDLKYANFVPFDRLYFGNEFCEHLMPTIDQLNKVLDFSKRFSMPLSFVTPFCSDSGLEKVESLLDALPPGTETVFNDFGVLAPIRNRNLIPVHGRLLCHSKKDPRIAARPASLTYHRTHNLQEPYLQFLKSKGVSRVELDNSPQGFDFSPGDGVRVSLHYPFIPATVTRKCAYSNSASGTEKYSVVGDCSGSCRGRTAELRLEGSPVLIQGNAHFFKNEKLPAELGKWKVDRLIYSPVIPNHNRFAKKDVCHMDWSYVYENKSLERLWGVKPEETLSTIMDELEPAKNSVLLDAGCGAGRNFPVFDKWKVKYYGLDVSDAAVAKAKAVAPDGTFFIGDIAGADFGGAKFDYVADIGCFHTLPPWRRKVYFRKIRSILKPRGVFMLAAWESFVSPAPVYFVMDQIPEWGCSEFDMREMVAGQFDIEDIKRSSGNNQDFLFFIMRKSAARGK